MKVEIYGRLNDVHCQDALAFFNSLALDVQFQNIDNPLTKEKLINLTEELQKKKGYKFAALNGDPYPIIISSDVHSVLVGFEEEFIKKYLQLQK